MFTFLTIQVAKMKILVLNITSGAAICNSLSDTEYIFRFACTLS